MLAALSVICYTIPYIMILRKTYRFKNWDRWDYELDDAVKSFFSASKQWPNILLANGSTLEQIDQIENEKREEENTEPQSVNSFSTAKYSLDFCEAEEVADESFSLIFDSDPEGENEDEEPVPEEDNL